VLCVLYIWLINFNFFNLGEILQLGKSLHLRLFIFVFLELGFAEEATNTCHSIIGLQLQLIFCMKHLYANKRSSGKKLKILWKAARSTHPTLWEKVMLTIKELNIMLTDTLLLYLCNPMMK